MIDKQTHTQGEGEGGEREGGREGGRTGGRERERSKTMLVEGQRIDYCELEVGW